MKQHFLVLGLVALTMTNSCKRLTGGSSGCNKDTDCKGDRVCRDGECVDPSVQAGNSVKVPGSASAPVQPTAAPPSIPQRAVGSSWTPDQQRWVQAFKFELPDGAPVGASWSEARKACNGKGLDLCTEDQWVLACAQESAVGKAGSWTLSSAGQGWVVRGGSGCDSASQAEDGSAAAGRIGLCCEPRASISSTNRQQAVMKAAQTYIKIIEDASNSGSAERVVKLLADPSLVYFTEMDHKQAQADIEGDLRRWTDFKIRLTRCDADVARANGSLECDTVAVRRPADSPVPELSVFRQRFEYTQFKYSMWGKPKRIVRKWGPYR